LEEGKTEMAVKVNAGMKTRQLVMNDLLYKRKERQTNGSLFEKTELNRHAKNIIAQKIGSFSIY